MSKTATTLDALIRAKARKEYLTELTALFEPVNAALGARSAATDIAHTAGHFERDIPDGLGGVKQQKVLSTRQVLDKVFESTYNAHVDAREQAAVDKFLSEFERLQAQVDEL